MKTYRFYVLKDDNTWEEFTVEAPDIDAACKEFVDNVCPAERVTWWCDGAE